MEIKYKTTEKVYDDFNSLSKEEQAKVLINVNNDFEKFIKACAKNYNIDAEILKKSIMNR